MVDEEKVTSIINGLCANQRLKRYVKPCPNLFYITPCHKLSFSERELLEVKKKITDVDFITRLIETILTRLSNISSETDQWEAAAGLISASVQLLNYCSEKQINLLYDLSFEHLDHQGLELFFGSKEIFSFFENNDFVLEILVRS